jgi:O-antigen ligase
VAPGNGRTPGTAPAAPTSPAARRRERIGLPLAIAFVGMATMGFNQIGIGFLPVSDLIFFGLAVVIWMLMLTGTDTSLTPRGARGASPRILVASVVLITMGVLAGFGSWAPDRSLQIVLRIAYLTLLWFWMLRCVVVDRRSVSVLMMGWRVAVIVSCLGAIAANAGLVTLGAASAENRQSAWFGHANDLAGFLAMAIPMFIVAAPRELTRRGTAPAARWALLIGIVVYGISTTGSISSVLAAMTGTAAAALGISQTRRRVPGARRIHPLTYMAGCVAAAVGLVLLVQSDVQVFERLTEYESGDSGVNASVDDRTRLNEEVVQGFDDVLLVGHGMNVGYTSSEQIGGNVHNVYLKLVFETGVIGAGALVFILGVTLKQGWMLMRSTAGTDLHASVAAIFGGAVAAITFAMFQPITTQRYFWLPIALTQCLWTLRRRELSRARELRPAPG